jgi:hypothetical protein
MSTNIAVVEAKVVRERTMTRVAAGKDAELRNVATETNLTNL